MSTSAHVADSASFSRQPVLSRNSAIAHTGLLRIGAQDLQQALQIRLVEVVLDLVVLVQHRDTRRRVLAIQHPPLAGQVQREPDHLQVVVRRRRRQALSGQCRVERLNLVAGDLVEALAAERRLDAQPVQLLVPIPRAFPQLHVRKVVLLEELAVRRCTAFLALASARGSAPSVISAFSRFASRRASATLMTAVEPIFW